MTDAHVEGFGERGGHGSSTALVAVDVTLGFTDPESLACDLEAPVGNIARLLDAACEAQIPVVFTTVA